jgi:CheY-like chemotaxis protein/anti-sigma regulatory factor (Ser/Thr protein kinase)
LIDLPGVVLAAVDAVRPAAQAKDIALDVAVDGDLGGFEGDAGRLQQVCGNLLTNAVKFTPRSGHVGVRLAERDGAAELAVSDTGQGISASFLPHVFERFRQADTTSTRAHGGLGLGLALVRTLVELHGGTVRAASPGEGKGAVFTVTLPRHGAARARCLRAPDAPAVPVLDGVKVLVVDDEPDARELIAAALESCGAEVHVAASALDALDALEEAQPHVLLSDLGMPHEDGYALIRRVRSLDPDRGGAIPAAALTAYAGPEIGQRARAAGFQVHVAKPVEPSRIAAVVAELAQRRGVA